MDKIIIIGAGGHAKVIADLIFKTGNALIGFLDDNVSELTLFNKPVLGKINNCYKYADCKFVIGIGDNSDRKRISDTYNLNYCSVIHPSAVIGKDVEIGIGSVIMANSVINVCTKIGKHCIINTGAIIEHDNVIDDFVHISPNATLAGNVKIGTLTHIGVSATIKNNIIIEKNNVIGAGAVVVKNTDNNCCYIGVPAKLMF